MAFWDRFISRKRIEQSSELARVLIGGGISKAGAQVNLQTALKVSTVLACARVIAEGIAQTPMKLIEKRGDARIERTDHQVYALLASDPNAWMTAFEFKELIAMHLVLCGNAYAYKTLGTNGEVLELLPLEPGWVTVKQLSDWSIEYKITLPGNRTEIVPAANIWHIRGPAWASYVGLDIVRLAREAIGLSIATEEFGSGLFSNGARPGGILSTEQSLKPEQQTELRDKWRELYEGAGNAMRTAVLSGGLKYESMSMNSDEAQFMETRRYQVEEVCRFMRVLPIMIGHSGDKNSTYASAEQMFNVHDKAHLGPWFARIEQSASKSLLTSAERRAHLKCKFMANGLLRASAADRSNYYKAALGSGGTHAAWMTQDEVRALEDLNPLGGEAAKLPALSQQQPAAQ